MDLPSSSLVLQRDIARDEVEEDDDDAGDDDDDIRSVRQI